MTVRIDLLNALAGWASDGHEASEITEQVFDAVISTIRKRFPDLTLAEAELLLADAKRDTEDTLFELVRDTVITDVVIDVIAQRFFGED